MPTRKQRRRQEKLRRHEWEDVWVDEEGEEVEPPPEAEHPAPRKSATPARRTAPARGGRAVRQVSPPSWRKVLRRAAIFAPIMFIVVYTLQKKADRSIAAALYQTALLLLFFVPFSYLMDRAMYRSYLRKTGAAPPAKKAK
jgi:hypothetical protein